MRVIRHAIDFYVWISAVLITVALGVPSLPPLTCFIETGAGVSVPCSSSSSYKEDCKLEGRQDVDRGASVSFPTDMEDEEEEEEKIIVKEKQLNSANSLIDISFPLWHTASGRAVVMVTGRSTRRWGHQQRRCVVVMVTASEPGQVTLRDLTLPHGSYQVRVMRRKRRGQDEVTIGGGGKDAVAVTRRWFVVPTKHRQRRIHSRSRRHKPPASRHYSGRDTLPTRDLILENLGRQDHRQEEQEEEEGGGGGTNGYSSSYNNSEGSDRREGVAGPCVCCKCYNFTLSYEEKKAVLSFSYQLNSTCDAACSTVNVQLYRDGHSHSAAQCKREKPHFLLAERIGLDRNVTEGPIQYGNVDTGCYFVELKPQLYRLPERTPSFWVTPAINVTDMENWDTYFSLEPNPERRSLTVRWTVSELYNFSSYHLILQHHPSIRINCTGKAIYPNMSIIPQRRLIVRQPLYSFYNLSSGWYCARVTPMDDRCPLDGCHVLSSPPQQLKEPVQWRCENGSDEGCEEKSVLGLTLLVVGCVVGAVVTGVTLAWGILHSWPSLSRMFNSATHYSPVPIRPAVKTSGGKKQIVLLVWTPQGPHGAKFGPIIAAFKTILRTYSHCEVYDYLDLASLPERQQLHLLASPTTWLDSILAQRSIKVIIVATEGAWQRQMEWKQPLPSPQRDHQNHLSAPHHAHDRMLFPYLLRRLHDQPDLAGDYSRVFHIRFSEVSHNAVELGNIVSWKRYKIPEHLRSLTVSLHGGVGAAGFEEPTEDQLKELREALTSHPQYCSHLSNGTGPPWPSVMTCSSLSPAALSNGSTKT